MARNVRVRIHKPIDDHDMSMRLQLDELNILMARLMRLVTMNWTIAATTMGSDMLSLIHI